MKSRYKLTKLSKFLLIGICILIAVILIASITDNYIKLAILLTLLLAIECLVSMKLEFGMSVALSSLFLVTECIAGPIIAILTNYSLNEFCGSHSAVTGIGLLLTTIAFISEFFSNKEW